ncbi:MAG TPA: outer membrane beta-barrel protein [bacterium]|nr:outer membrane beta-barrel protein [bacterium]
MFKRFFAALVVFLSFPSFLFADYKLYDAIQEFGEKRYVQTAPAHLKTGPVRIHPVIENKVTYDSNILQQDQDAREDVVFNVRPGAIIELPINKHQLAVGYQADFEIFSKRKNGNQKHQNQNFFALADFNFPSWYVNVLEELAETSSRSGTTFTERIPRIDQMINPKAGYKWKRFTFESGFRNFQRHFRRQIDRPFSFQDTGVNGVIFYDLFANLKALMDYQWNQLDYDDGVNRNATINQVRIGLEGEVFRNVVVKARLGTQFRNYRASSEPDFYSWVGNLSLEYRARPNLTFKFFILREPAEATFADVNYYKDHSVGGGFEYLFRPRWPVFSNLRLSRHTYAERATVGDVTAYRRDLPISVRSGIRYLLNDYLQFEAAYEYLHRNSNFSTLGYNDHLVSLSSQLAY